MEFGAKTGIEGNKGLILLLRLTKDREWKQFVISGQLYLICEGEWNQEVILQCCIHSGSFVHLE